ncbi:MAG: HAMP domain-containing histidine kinase [Anaerolineae bacterium]|nr:HAMP domain-containing histidine kinase [Anaerolineae bacterium]
MFRSIRWRLVLSTTLLTLLTVGVMGGLSLSLVKRYVDRQEIEHLTQNAEAVARQAAPLMTPTISEEALSELAQTSAFLSNARVKILDPESHVLADSVADVDGSLGVWILTPVERWGNRAERRAWPVIVGVNPEIMPQVLLERMMSGRQSHADAQIDEILSDALVAHWEQTTWGSDFRFDVVDDDVIVTPTGQILEMTALAAGSRSSQKVRVATVGETGEVLGYVEISNGPNFSADALMTTRRAFLFAGGGAILIAVLVGLWMSRGLSAPLRTLTETAGQMSQGDLSIRTPMRGKDEIGQLSTQFNQMAERLEASFAEVAAERDALRRFVADASHELRTPITALKTFNDLLQDAAADDAVARTEFLQESQFQLERLEWVTHNLLDLSRFDAGLVTLDKTDVNAENFIQHVVGTFKVRAQDANLTLLIHCPDTSLTLYCDRERMEMALSNLVDNALKFTAPGGQVTVGAEQNEASVRLWVRDTGQGIAPEDLPHIFERFYRGSGVRATGSGLGLAIVQSIAQAHGGHVFVESEPGEGSFFAIELPARS